MPVQFLSEGWANELKGRLNADEEFKKSLGSKNATLLQVVGGGDGERRFWLQIDNGTVDLQMGNLQSPDATITEDYETAVALAQGQLNPVSAFMSGKIKISGNMMLLMQLQGPLTGLPRVMREMDVDY